MAGFSRKGWVIRTALRDGREFFEHFDEDTPRSERRSEIEMRALIEKRLNYFEFSIPDPKDQAQDGEVVWIFRERGPFGVFKGSHIRFLAPNINAIRRTRQQDAEKARLARKAMKERSEIRRAMKPDRRTVKLSYRSLLKFANAAHHHIAHATTSVGGKTSPKFGLLSQIASQIAVIPYGLEIIKNRYPKSFVDGKSIFVSDDLIRTIVDDGSKSGGNWMKLLPLILLQEMRILMNHSTRLKTLFSGTVIPEDVAQIAGETSAYSKLRMGYPELSWAPCIEQDIAASVLSREALRRYSVMAEEEIAYEIMDACESVSPTTNAEGLSERDLLAALPFMDMNPTLCTHIACRDSNFALLAIADQESRDKRRATRRTKKTAPKPGHGVEPPHIRRL